MEVKSTTPATAISRRYFLLGDSVAAAALGFEPPAGMGASVHDNPLQADSSGNLCLWYDRPAKTWMTEALPIGNGPMGAMIFGGTEIERIQFNEITLIRPSRGKWQVMKFTHIQAPGLGQNGQVSVDGASRDCTEWFLQDSLYDCDWLPFEVFEGKAELTNREVTLSRERLQRIIDAGVRRLAVARLAEGDDPAFGVVKTLEAECTAGDQRITLKGTDPETLSWGEPSPLDQELNRLAEGRPYTASPVAADPLEVTCTLSADIDLSTARVDLELDGLTPEEAASITVNGAHAGGFIGKPFRLDVTGLLKSGSNTIRIEPFSPRNAKLVVY